MKRILGGVIALASLGCAAPSLRAPRVPFVWTESFDRIEPKRWRGVEVKRYPTAYDTAELDGRSCLRAESRNSASSLVTELHFDPNTHQRLSWDWRVDQLVEGEALARKDDSDAAAWVYVYFKTPGLPWRQRSLDYVWSSALPKGTRMHSAYSSRSKIIVVESGSASVGTWQHVERNLQEDYRQAFGEDPTDVVAISLMTDTDNTGGHAVAYFDELQIGAWLSKP